jgi:hypothetical protein
VILDATALGLYYARLQTEAASRATRSQGNRLLSDSFSKARLLSGLTPQSVASLRCSNFDADSRALKRPSFWPVSCHPSIAAGQADSRKPNGYSERGAEPACSGLFSGVASRRLSASR